MAPASRGRRLLPAVFQSAARHPSSAPLRALLSGAGFTTVHSAAPEQTAAPSSLAPTAARANNGDISAVQHTSEQRRFSSAAAAAAAAAAMVVAAASGAAAVASAPAVAVEDVNAGGGRSRVAHGASLRATSAGTQDASAAVAAASMISMLEGKLSHAMRRSAVSCEGRDAEPGQVSDADAETAAGLPAGFLEELLLAVGSDRERVVVDEEERMSHAKPWSSYHPVVGVPDAVVFPMSTNEVAAVVRLCSRHGVALTPYGAGTSTEGHITTPRSGVSLDMRLFDKVKALHVEDMDVVVEQGIGWMDLNAYLKPYGLFFPLDPGPGATIGGMCATRCSGSLAVRYGTMRDNVIALQAVLANGDVVRTSARARKSAAGYDLTRLLIGSEGTLGVITEVTLRLQKIPPHSAVAMCSFPSVFDAAKAATDTMHLGIQVSRVEMLDEVMMHAINNANGYSYAEQPTLMYELVGNSQAHVEEQVRAVEAVVKVNHGSNFTFAQSEEAKAELWRARKEALWAGYTLRPGTEPLITDVCVPLSRLAECIAETKKDLEKSSLPCPLLAHAGDGNMHVCIFFDTSKPEEVAEAKDLAKRMTLRALAMEGTCTGEHGVGVGKVEYLEKELGPEAVAAMQRVKHALDPLGIMNPGKVLPSLPNSSPSAFPQHLCS